MSLSLWENVADAQEAAMRFVYSEIGRAYGRAFGQSIINTTDSPEYRQMAEERGWTMPRYGEQHWATGIPELLRTTLTLAEPIYVNGEYRDLIEAASETWQHEPLIAEDIYPTLYGFVLFDRPFVIHDIHGKRLSFRAFSWTPIDTNGHVSPLDWTGVIRAITPANCTGILLSAFAHRDDPDDYPLEDVSDILNVSNPEWSLSYITPWHFDSHAPVDAGGANLASVTKIAQVMWRLAKQTIVVPESRRLPRPERRRAERANLKSDVTVITLRHSSPPKSDGEHEGGGIEYDHRWFVRGHWRNQYYSSDSTHRQIWISPYIKGPEDKPLHIKPLRAFELVR